MQSAVGGLGGGSAPPAPSGWTAQRFPASYVFFLGFLALLTAGIAAGAVWAFVDRQPGPGVLLGLGAVYIGHLVGLGYSVAGRSRRTGPPPTLTTGLRFRYSAGVYYWLTAVLVMTELAVAGPAVAGAASATAAGIVLALVATAGAVAIGWFLVTMLRLAPGEVVLAPDGVHHRGLTFIHVAPWHTITSVSAEWVTTPVIVVRAAPAADAQVRRYTGRFGPAELRFLPFMVIRAYWLATNPAIVYQALAFYHAHPELRPELATQASLDRISEGRAVT
jgi:hypothetical protein